MKGKMPHHVLPHGVGTGYRLGGVVLVGVAFILIGKNWRWDVEIVRIVLSRDCWDGAAGK